MGGQLQTTFHALVVAWYLLVDLHLVLIGLMVLFTRWDIIVRQYGLGVQYLTLWNLFFQQGYFLLSLKEDLVPRSFPFSAHFEKFLSIIFHSLIFPLSLLIAFDFWAVYMLDARLLDPFNALEDFLTNINHSLHSTIVPIVVMELLISDRPRKFTNFTDTLFNLLVFHLCYLTVVYVLYLMGNVWPYPFLNHLNFSEKISLALLNSLGGTLMSSIIYYAKDHFQIVFETVVKCSLP